MLELEKFGVINLNSVEEHEIDGGILQPGPIHLNHRAIALVAGYTVLYTGYCRNAMIDFGAGLVDGIFG